MRISRSIICAAIILFISTAIYAEKELVLTWEDCVSKAISNNPALMSAKEELKQNEADREIAQSVRKPQIDAQLEGRRSERESVKTDSYSAAITGRQLLYDGSQSSWDIEEKNELIRSSRYNYSVVSSDVRLDLRIAFVELLQAQELIYLTENIAKRRKQNFDLVKLRYEAGREHKGSLLTAEADLAQADFEVEQALRSIPFKQRQLSKGLGLDNIMPVKVAGEFVLEGDYGAIPDLASIADSTPFLNNLIARKEAARYNLKSVRADSFPKVYLSGSAGRASSDFPPDQSEWSVGLSLSVPLFDGGSRSAEESRARSRLHQLEAEESSGKDSVLVTLEKSWRNVRDSITNLSVQKKFLDAAEERAKIAIAQYETGIISFDDWIIIENNFITTRKNYLNAQADMLIAEAYWIQATGGILEYDQE